MQNTVILLSKAKQSKAKQSKAKQSKAKLLLYILTNNFKFLSQKYFLDLVKSFLTFINFDNLFEMEFTFGYKILNYLRRF